MVEHTAVNRGVVGSSPTRGVEKISKRDIFFLFQKKIDRKFPYCIIVYKYTI